MKIGAHYLGENRCEFTLWAPHATSVTVQIVAPQTQQIPMQKQDWGYWRVVADGIQPGTQYLYQLNEDTARPDPASNFQPQGVHQPSQVVDHHFNWSDSAWSGVPLEDMIIYELHVGTFTPEGTFEAIIARLQDLKALGVNAVELMPVAQFPGDRPTDDPAAYRNWGYDGVYPYAVQNSYGGPEGLRRLVNACHQQGVAVILDVVYNHFGPEGNYLSCFAPYFTDTYRTPWGNAINFDDAHSPEVRNYFIQNALYWLRDYHIDALRLDAIHAIYDLGAKHFLEDLGENVAALSTEQGRKLYLIAESDLNDPRVIRPVEQGGYGMDAQWSDDFHHAIHTLVTEDQLGYYQDYGQCEHLAKAYRDTFVYDWKYSPHRQRFHGNSALDRPPSQFVICTQNHDQVGNRMLGERLTHLTSYDGLKLAAGALILSPYIPMLFMGEEYGEEAYFTYFVSHSDPDLIQAVRKGRKEEFAAFHAEGEPSDPEAAETFLKCKLNWEKRQEGKHQVLWSLYQHLIQLRNTIPALKQRDRQSMEVFSQEEEKLLYWRRWADQNQILCLMNFNQNDVSFSPNFSQKNWRKILDSADEKWLGKGSLLPEKLGGETVTVRSHSFALYENLAS
jgi:maltooligosyltrehalose trehalohydrolase